MAADSKAMQALHAELAKVLTNAIKNGQEVVTKEGEVVKQDAPAAVLSVARQFLKDNDITSGKGAKDMSELERALADMEDMPFDGEVPTQYQ